MSRILNKPNQNVDKPVEFSNFFIVLNEAKEGKEEKKEELQSLIEQYGEPENTDSYLHELGQIFINIGMLELYKYSGYEDITIIGSLDKASWEELEKKNKSELPPHLANTMINYAKKENLSQRIAKKWDTTKRELNKHIMNMARYITEGIIDAID